MFSFFKKNIKLFCPPIIWTFLSRVKDKSLFTKYNGLNQLDRKIEKFLNYNNGYFVELGANNGITQSNSLYFEKYKGWSGVLVEPIGHKFIECVKNRSKKNSIFCNACVSFDYKEKFVEMVYSNLMTVSHNLESDLKNPTDHAVLGKKNLYEGELNYVFGSIAKPLNDILIEAKAPKEIDLFSLDVEGAEIDVLKGVNHTEFRFKYICVESRDIKKLSKYMEENNYILKEKLTNHDYLFKNNI